MDLTTENNWRNQPVGERYAVLLGLEKEICDVIMKKCHNHVERINLATQIKNSLETMCLVDCLKSNGVLIDA